MTHVVTYKRISKGKYGVFTGRKRVGLITENGKYVQAETKYLGYIQAFITDVLPKIA